MMFPPSLLGFGFPTIGLPELVVIGVLGLLIFGKRLPEVGRSLGKGIVQFKKGLREVESEVDVASTEKPSKTPPKQEGDGPAEPDAAAEPHDTKPPGE